MDRCWSRLAYLWSALVTIGIFVAAQSLHPMLTHSAENDGYLHFAEGLLAGQWPMDPHRPLLYHLMVAGLGSLVGDCFLAGKIVSSFAVGLATLATFFVGRRLHGTETGLLAAVIVGTNSTAILHGMLVCTDALFMATTTVGGMLLLRLLAHPGRCALVLAGLALALGYFARYTAIAMLPAAFAALCLMPRTMPLRRRALWFGVGALVGLLPHMVLTWIQFGAPFHDETWRSLAFRHFGNGDWRYLDSNPFDGLWSVLRHDPILVWTNALEELRSFSMDQAGSFLMPALPSGAAAWLLAGLAVTGATLLLRQRPREALIALGVPSTYLFMISLTFLVSVSRLLLPLLPWLAILTARGLLALLAASWRTRQPKWRCVPLVAGVGMVLTLAAFALPPFLRWFAATHPVRELELLRELCGPLGREGRVLGNLVGLERDCPCQYQLIYLPPSSEDVFEQVLWTIRGQRVDYVLTSQKACTATEWEALGKAAVPRCLEVVRDEPGLRLFRSRPRPHQDYLAGEPSIVRLPSNGLRVTCPLRTPIDDSLTVQLIAVDEAQVRHVLPMSRMPEAPGEVSLVVPSGVVGTWRLTVHGWTGDGDYFIGPELVVEL